MDTEKWNIYGSCNRSSTHICKDDPVLNHYLPFSLSNWNLAPDDF